MLSQKLEPRLLSSRAVGEATLDTVRTDSAYKLDQRTVIFSRNQMSTISRIVGICTGCANLSARPRYVTGVYISKRHSSHVVRDGRPFRMAVLGSGPAGFYTAYKVMSIIENAIIDMYECLPVPFGLVRFGVAPDHPEVKVKEIPKRLTFSVSFLCFCCSFLIINPFSELPRQVWGSCFITSLQFYRQRCYWQRSASGRSQAPL